MIAGFWIRLLSDFIDALVLGAVGTVLLLPLGDLLDQMGTRGAWLGLPIAFLYTGLLQSRIGEGQTVGKKLLKIQVVTMDGHFPTVPMALLRYLIISLVGYGGAVADAVGTALPALVSPLSTTVYSAFSLFLLFGCTLLVLMNPLKRGVHDLIANTVVVYRGTFDAARIHELHVRSAQRTRFQIALLATAALALAVSFIWFLSPVPSVELLRVQSALVEQTQLRDVGVRVLSPLRASDKDRAPMRKLVISGRVRGAGPLDSQEARRVARVALRAYGDPAFFNGGVVVRVESGRTLGIASSYRAQETHFSLPSLQAEPPPPPPR